MRHREVKKLAQRCNAGPRIACCRQLAQRDLSWGLPTPLRTKKEQFPSRSAPFLLSPPKIGPAGPKVTGATGTCCAYGPCFFQPQQEREGRAEAVGAQALPYLPTLLLFLRSSESTVGAAAAPTAHGQAESCRGQHSLVPRPSSH